MKLIIVLFSFLIMGAGMPAYAATTFGFSNITTSEEYYDEYLSVEVSETVDVGNVLFTFMNTGSTFGFIADIYFSNEPVYFNSIVSIDNALGVNFAEGAKPDHLPGYEDSNYWEFSADSETPNVSANGIQAGESLGIVMKLAAGKKINEIIESLGVDGGFFIGLHVQGLNNGDSLSFLSNPDGGEGGSGGPVVPIPAAIWLFGSALIGLMGVSRKQKAMAA